MMGVPLHGATNVVCDNKYIVDSACKSEPTLKKNNISLIYHKCREIFAVGMIKIYFQFSEDNLADLLTKVFSVVKKKNIFGCIFA